MVNSTGKLYHHKIKLLRLKFDSDNDEMLEYIKKRHPLYFTTDKMMDDQMIDLIKRLKYKLKMQAEKEGKLQTTEQKVQEIKQKQKEKAEEEKPKQSSLLGPLPSLGGGSTTAPGAFKTGSSLPSIQGNGSNKENEYKKVNKDFMKLDLDQNDFEDDFDNDEEEEEGGDEDFDTNKLLDLGGYQNKRDTGPKKQNAIEIEDDGWGLDSEEEEDQEFDYKAAGQKNLNQCTTKELEKHKKAMDSQFQKNNLKPGDKGFVYDKRIDFEAMKAAGAGVEDSW